MLFCAIVHFTGRETFQNEFIAKVTVYQFVGLLSNLEDRPASKQSDSVPAAQNALNRAVNDFCEGGLIQFGNVLQLFCAPNDFNCKYS